MMLFVAMAAAKPPPTYLIPFPTSPVFEGEQRYCLDVNQDFGISNVEVEDGPFMASCGTEAGHTRLCLTLLDDSKWPDKLADLECPGDPPVRMRPVLGFDPLDDIADGVEMVHGVSKLQAAFKTPGIDKAYGILPGGHCWVQENLLTVIVGDSETRRQSCTLLLPGEEERVVPIRLVSKLRR